MRTAARCRPIPAGPDPRYAAYFVCFHRADYYEAHDVLEDLWLETRGSDRAFYKGLIQLAGAFVHLRRQRERPWHPKDGRRTAPAARLLALAESNLRAFGPLHLGLDVPAVLELAAATRERIGPGGTNPWDPSLPPRLPIDFAQFCFTRPPGLG